MMKRGEIYYARLDPTEGSEIRKPRPVLIISSDMSNKQISLLTVLPITSSIKKIYDVEVKLDIEDSGLSKPSKIQCYQVRTISKSRIASKMIGKVNQKILFQVENALKLHLNFY